MHIKTPELESAGETYTTKSAWLIRRRGVPVVKTRAGKASR